MSPARQQVPISCRKMSIKNIHYRGLRDVIIIIRRIVKKCYRRKNVWSPPNYRYTQSRGAYQLLLLCDRVVSRKTANENVVYIEYYYVRV